MALSFGRASLSLRYAMTSETIKRRRQAYSLPTGWLAYTCLSGNGFFATAVLAWRLLQPELLRHGFAPRQSGCCVYPEV